MGDEQRELIATRRFFGSLVEWEGSFGWIRPSQPINHPLSGLNGGKIYLAAEDVQEEIEGVGASVTFFAYADPAGLGASNVRPAPPGSAGDGGGSSPGYRPAAAEKASKGGKTAGFKGGDAYGKAYQLDDGCAKGGKMQLGEYGGAPPGLPGPAKGKFLGCKGGCKGLPDPIALASEVMERVTKILYDGIWKATQEIMHLESDWGHNEVVKRISKYFNKAAQSPELFTLPYQKAAEQFIEHAMQGYSAACGDKAWFFELDLGPCILEAVWEIVKVSSALPRANYPELEKFANGQYEEVMDKILLDKAMYDATTATFGLESPVNGKVYKALNGAHEKAYIFACENKRALQDLQKVELFLMAWMENSMGRAWQAIDNADLMSEENVTRLFENLVAPFGEDHPFSCVPAALTQSIGRPPMTWPFIAKCSQQVFKTWSTPSSRESYNKRRRLAKGKGKGAGKNYTSGAHGAEEYDPEDDFFVDDEDALLKAALEQADCAEGYF